MISVHTQLDRAWSWLNRYGDKLPHFSCIVGFTETAMILGISAAGKEPIDRRFTAHADAEFLLNGVSNSVTFPLPNLTAGASPTFISRAIVEALQIPVFLIDAGLPQPLSVVAQVLSKTAARCVSTGHAMPIETVKSLFYAGRAIGREWSQQHRSEYLLIGECVVAGTTTALAVLLGLGIDAAGKVNSSHVACNHDQKLNLARQGLASLQNSSSDDPDYGFQVLAAVGDPMQPVAAGMAIGASELSGVLLAGGTQMLAVAAIAQTLAKSQNLEWRSENVVVGTTRWVVDDPSGDTVGLAKAIGGVPLLSTNLNFQTSRYEQLRMYEQGFVKEGVGAGGCAIAAELYANWDNEQMVRAIEDLLSMGLNSQFRSVHSSIFNTIASA
jgi:uncharacterized protein (TIGR00303 family)